MPEPDTEYLLWQTLAGAWPIDSGRRTGYLRKAMREAKTATSWTDPDEDYEAAVLGLADRVLGDGELSRAIAGFATGLAGDARVNSLGMKLVQLTMPGAADVYQGCELAASLVDPDTAGRWTSGRRRQLLAALDAGRRRPAWMRRNCWSPRPRCGCAGSARTGSPAVTSRWPPKAPPRGMPWRSPGAARR